MRMEQLKGWRHHKRLLVAVVEDEAAVVAAVRRLQQIGVPPDQISLLALDTQRVHAAIEAIGPYQGQAIRQGETENALAEQASPKGRDEVQGMAVGSGVGLLIGLGVFALPGLGAVLLAAGPVVMAINVLGHTIAGGAGLGLVLGAILDEHVTEAHRDYYKARLQAGNWLLVVHGDEASIQRAATAVSGDRVARVESF
jgi:hypothetical protein